MAEMLSGKAVSEAMSGVIKADVSALNNKGITPALAIIRVGENESDMSYERGAVKRCENLGIECRKYLLNGDASEGELLNIIDEVNNDKDIHGALLFRPLPKHMDSKKIENALDPAKDVDCMTEASLCGVFTGRDVGYPPCTPEACLAILDHYNIGCEGKNIVVIGRSLVVGKPVSMMLLKKNATVTICHTKTKDVQNIAKGADIIIAACGRAGVVGADYVREGQIIIDVGINVNDEGRLCGDVDYTAVEPIVSAITPVPGGVGSVTTAVLMKHVVDAALKAAD